MLALFKLNITKTPRNTETNPHAFQAHMIWDSLQ